MTYNELGTHLKEAHLELFYNGCPKMSEAVTEAIRLLTIYHQQPTVEEVGDDDECLHYTMFGPEILPGSYVRASWTDGDRWAYLRKEYS